jgi:signal peptidase II
MPMNSPKALVATGVLSAFAAVVIDQVSKTIVRAALAVCPDGPIEACDRITLVGPFGVLRSDNPGSALGLFGRDSIVPLLVIAVVLLAAQLWLAGPSRLLAIGLGLQAGGLAANVIDRVAYGSVTDFLHVQIAGGLGPVANIADVALVVGGVLGAVACWRALGADTERHRRPVAWTKAADGPVRRAAMGSDADGVGHALHEARARRPG